MSSINKQIEEVLKEDSYRPADNIANGQIEPVTITPEDLAAAEPTEIPPYPAALTPVEVEDIDEKDFVASNPELDAGYMVDPVVDNLGEEAIVSGIKMARSGGVEHIIANHNEVSDADASAKYESSLLAKHHGAKVLRVAGSDTAFVVATPEGDVAQCVTKKGQHFIRYSEMKSVPLEKGHVSSIVTDNMTLHEGLEEDGKAILETAMAKLAKDALYEAKTSGDFKDMCTAQGLNEDFTDKATDLFEAAVVVAGKKYMGLLESAAEGYIAESLNEYQDKIQDKMNTYLEYVVNEWVEENRIALEAGSRTQIAESFMDGLKGLLESHYVELPVGKKDLYESAIDKGQEILEQLNTQTSLNESLQEQVNQLNKKLIIESAVQGMPLVKAEKVRELAEAVDFEDSNKFSGKVQFITESVTGKVTNKPAKAPASLMEDKSPVVSDKPLVEGVDDEIATYLRFLTPKQ